MTGNRENERTERKEEKYTNTFIIHQTPKYVFGPGTTTK